MNRFLIFISLFLISSSAFALKLSGQWVGFGDWTFQGSTNHCNPMTMNWNESPLILELSSGEFDCGLFVMYLDKTAWKKQNEKLFDFSGKEVGSYTGNLLHVFIPLDNTTTVEVTLDRTRKTSYDYTEVWHSNNEKLHVITGRFFNGNAE